MAKVKVSVTYTATLDTGDVPDYVIEKALEADDGNFNIWEQGQDILVSAVEIKEVA